MSITLLPTTSTNSQQVNTLVEEFLDYNEDDANLSISSEVVDIEEIIDDLKSVDNEEENLYSPPPIPLMTTAQARSHLTGLVQYLEVLSVSKLPGGAKPNLNVVVARQQLQTLEQALTRNMHAYRIQSSIIPDPLLYLTDCAKICQSEQFRRGSFLL